VGNDRRCPECGALLGEAAACKQLFHAALAMEWVDPPSTGAAHHLLVATYMLQHPSGFTAEGRSGFAAVVAATVDERLSARQLRWTNRRRFEQQDRDWRIKVTTPNPPELREWQMTIADAIDGDPHGLPERVWAWARSVREDLRAEGL
jgi:Family of unknown function (DUF5946)